MARGTVVKFFMTTETATEALKDVHNPLFQWVIEETNHLWNEQQCHFDRTDCRNSLERQVKCRYSHHSRPAMPLLASTLWWVFLCAHRLTGDVGEV